MSEEIYLAGGCLWGVQAYVRTLPGVTLTEAGRANGASGALDGEYDGYAECVRTWFDPGAVTVGLTGCGGGLLKDLADICIIVPDSNIDKVEDIHLMLGHVITSCLRA